MTGRLNTAKGTDVWGSRLRFSEIDGHGTQVWTGIITRRVNRKRKGKEGKGREV